MAKVGYIYNTPHANGLTEDGGVDAILRLCTGGVGSRRGRAISSVWKQLLANLNRGDEIVVSKLSNAVRGSRELAVFIELYRVKVVRIVSIHDRINTGSKLFHETTVADVLLMFGSLPEEAMALRRASDHVQNLQRNLNVRHKTKAAETKQERESTIVSMYTVVILSMTSGLSVVSAVAAPSSAYSTSTA